MKAATQQIPASYQAVITENKKVRLAWHLAELSLDGITGDQFAVRWPGVNPADALADAEMCALVEQFAGRPALQDAALNARLRRGLGHTLTTLTAKLEDDDCTPSMAREIGDTMTKIANLIDRRNGNKYQEPERRLIVADGTVTVTTPEGRRELRVRRPQERASEVMRAMRCTTEAECEVVSRALSRLFNTLTLPGW